MPKVEADVQELAPEKRVEGAESREIPDKSVADAIFEIEEIDVVRTDILMTMRC